MYFKGNKFDSDKIVQKNFSERSTEIYNTIKRLNVKDTIDEKRCGVHSKRKDYFKAMLLMGSCFQLLT